MINEINENNPSIDDIDKIDTVINGKTPEYIYALRDEFLDLMEEAEDTHIIGEIGSVRPELAGTHSNQVLMTELPINTAENSAIQGSNNIRFFEIHYQDKPLITVFKPASGENKARLDGFQLPRMYTRERAAYVIDYYMHLGIVPPTIIREIDGEMGSMQLYIPHTNAQSPNVSRELHDKQDFSGSSWKKIAMFDNLIGNRDRNNGNYLVCFSDPSEFYAIDHGCSFCKPQQGDMNLAYDFFKKHFDQAELDDGLRNSLQNLLGSEKEIMTALPEDVSGYIEHQAVIQEKTIFDRARIMLETNSILVE